MDLPIKNQTISSNIQSSFYDRDIDFFFKGGSVNFKC